MRRVAKIAALAALVAVALSSCSLLLISGIDSRIANFESDLNDDDRSLMYLNFSPELTESYDQIKNESYFENSPLNSVNGPFEIEVTDRSDPEAVKAVFTNANLTEAAVTFFMVRDGLGWLIREFGFDGDSEPLIKRP